MTAAHKRQKDPDGVRRGLLDHASAIAARQGLTDVTVAAVASAAGVTKGGLFHHFTNKKALVEAMFDDQLEQLGERLNAIMGDDPVHHGRFTRAYVIVATSVGEEDRRIWGALSSALSPGSDLCQRWYAWLDECIEAHHETDASPGLEIIRLAADGAWLMAITRIPMIDFSRLRDRLLFMTGDAVSS